MIFSSASLPHFQDAPDWFQRLAEQCPAALIVADREGLICYWNPRATELFG